MYAVDVSLAAFSLFAKCYLSIVSFTYVRQKLRMKQAITQEIIVVTA